jgi:hypothetical protein
VGMREIAYWLLTNWPAFTNIIPANRVFEQSAIGKDPTQTGIDATQGPFAVLSMFGPFPILGGKTLSSQSAEVRVTVHTSPGTFSVHDDALREASAAFLAAESSWVQGYWLMEARWTDTGDDFLDDGFGTNIKTASHHFVASTVKLR